MVEVVRDLGGMPVFDALSWPNVTRAWQTVLGSPDLRPVSTRLAWVGLPYEGSPPGDAEIIRLSGLGPDANGIIRIPFDTSAEEERFSILGFNFTDPARRARWGMLVLELSGDK